MIEAADLRAHACPCLMKGFLSPCPKTSTQWTNLVAAHEGLSGPLQRLAQALRAVHRFRAPGEDSRRGARINANLLIAEHPVVRVHPESELITGRPFLAEPAVVAS